MDFFYILATQRDQITILNPKYYLEMEANYNDKVAALADSELSKDQIIAELNKLELTEEKVELLLKSVYGLRHKKNQKTGLILLGVGCLTLISGFLLTLFLFYQNLSIHYVMYGLTTIGIILIFSGIIKCLGW